MFFTVREGKDKLWLLEQYREEWYVTVFFNRVVEIIRSGLGIMEINIFFQNFNCSWHVNSTHVISANFIHKWISVFIVQTEDEALAQAIQMSMAESSQPTQPSKP